MGELYRLEFPNGKSYIGISRVGAKHRYVQHTRDAHRHTTTTPLHQAWRKHGPPRLVVLAVLENDELPAVEIRAIKAFGTLSPCGYNMSEGGQISSMHNPEVAAKVAAALTGKKLSAEHRAKLREVHKGIKPSAETRAKRAASLKGHVVSSETRAKISESNKRIAANPSAKRIASRKVQAEKIGGRTLSDAHRAAISAGNKGRVFTAETRAKISAALKGRKFSAERRAAMCGHERSEATRQKLSAANKGRKWSPEAIEARKQGVRNMSPERRAAWLAKLSARRPSAEHRAKLADAAKADWARRKREKRKESAMDDLFDAAAD
ncbi:MAG: NUMOD3 domain-containing DNA-binding protein [Bauldia sp.]